LLACSEIQLQELMDRLERVSKKYGLLINVEKTKVMTTDASSCKIDINNMLVEVVSSFPYHGSLITDDAECTKDIQGKLQKAVALEQRSRRSGRITAYVFLQRSVL